MREEELLLVHVPAIVAVLLNRERKKGSPLTEEEVLDIRDRGECIAMPRDVASKVADSRGYDDIDPEHVWEQWQEVRKDFTRVT